MVSRKAWSKSFLLLVLFALIGWQRPAEALIATHECAFCHDFHGAISYDGLLKYSSTEVLCLSCHSTINGTTEAAAVHNPLNLASNQQGYITCRECHNPHDNMGGNIKLIGYGYDPETGQSFASPKIRVELSTSDPDNPVYKTVTYNSAADFNIADAGIDGACEICHAPPHGEGQDCTVCHGHSGEFLPVGGGDCRFCHDGSGPGAEFVSVDSPHSTNTLNSAVGVLFTCENCHTGHQQGNVQIPNNNAVGIMYNSTGHDGISLGADDGNPNDAVGSTQADICWNCHGSFTPVVSEWGTNSGGSYDYGSLHSSAGDSTASPGNHVNWTTGYWKSANFTYKNGSLNTRPVFADLTYANPTSGSASVHATGGTVGTPSDALADISCAYCHDVHDTMGPNGKPYLRGSWTPNPFPEDGAPRAGIAAYATTDYGGVPRGGTGTKHPLSWTGDNKNGGWQIEQNNSAFSWGGYASGAGLCYNCHTPASIEASLSWTGHNAVVPGFGGSDAASNIFTTTKRGGSGGYLRGHMRHANTTAYDAAKGWVYGLRSAEAGSGQNPPQYGIAPKIDPNQPQTGANLDLSALLGVTVDAGTTDANFHHFPCSKCHTPHASRLPRLMITNCLDVKNNTWDDAIDPTSWSPISGTNGHTAKQLAYASSATNCHRYVSGSDPNRETNGSNETGWNSVTPW